MTDDEIKAMIEQAGLARVKAVLQGMGVKSAGRPRMVSDEDIRVGVLSGMTAQEFAGRHGCSQQGAYTMASRLGLKFRAVDVSGRIPAMKAAHKKKSVARRAAFNALVANGMGKATAARLMGLSPSYGYQPGLK